MTRLVTRTGAAAIAMILVGLLAPDHAGAADAELAARIQKLTRGTEWKQIASQKLGFAAHHPQGMVKIGDAFFMSSVEITKPTTRYPQPQGGYDRDTGEGVGHLFKFSAEGKLVASIKLGEGSIYHPGGIDYDGRHLWVPVAEYRPNSQAIIYRVDPQTLQVSEVFRFRDHVGGIVHDTEGKALHGVSWGSRRFYKWPLDGEGRVTNAAMPPEQLRVMNPALYIDYQDCHALPGSRMLCSGLNAYTPKGIANAPTFRLGGFEIVDLKDNRPVFQVPIEIWSPSGLPMTQNPFFVETSAQGLTAYFVPDDDDRATLFTYEAAVK